MLIRVVSLVSVLLGSSFGAWGAPPAIQDGLVYKEVSRPEIFLIKNGKKLWIPSPDALANLGFTFNQVTVLPDGALTPLERLPDLNGPLLDALLMPVDTGVKPSRVFFVDPDQELRLYPACSSPVFDWWCIANYHPTGSSKNPRSIVKHDVFVAGWIRKNDPNCKGGGDGTNPLCDEDYHYQLIVDVDFIDAMYGPNGLISSLANFRLPGNPAAAATLPFADMDEYGKNRGVTVNSFILPNAEPQSKDVATGSSPRAELHVEVNAWHVDSTYYLWRDNWIGYGSPPNAWIPWVFAPTSSQLSNERAHAAQSWWAFRPDQIDGSQIQSMQYVIMRGTLWQDFAHDDATDADSNPWEVAMKDYGGWLEMHPPDLIKRSRPFPSCTAFNGNCRKKSAYLVAQTSMNTTYQTFDLIADMADDQGNALGLVRPGYSLHFLELIDGRFTEPGSYERQAAVTGPGVVNVQLRLFGTAGRPARYKATYILWWEPGSTQSPPLPPPTPQDRLESNQLLTPGQSLVSPNERFRLTLQTDGNLVLYRGGTALWATATNGKPAARTIMQADGNLVLYDVANQPLWATHTSGNPGSYVRVQDDGNIVIYRPDNSVVWATNTVQPVDNPVTPASSVYYQIVTFAGKVLDIDANSCADGAHVIQYGWNGGNNQRWHFERQGDGSYMVVNKASHKVLDVTGGPTALAAGTKVQQWTNLDGSNQHWRIEDAGGGLVRMVAVHSGQVHDVEAISTRDLARLQQWPWLNGPNQQFALKPISGDIWVPFSGSTCQ